MGPYCQYCKRRCFLLRVLRDGRTILLATCDSGMTHDLISCGETHDTALNPVTQSEEVAALVQTLQEQTVETEVEGPRRWPLRCDGREAGGRAVGLTVCLWKVDHPPHPIDVTE
jgi:hypothetical protein